jgi:hypothetical protein
MSRLIEVWGDTVDSRHMCGAIIIGGGLAAPTFLIGREIFQATVDDPTLADSYALLLGLAACLVAATIAARLFKPKRIVRETSSVHGARREALARIAAEGGVWTDPAELEPQVREELRRLGLYDVLVQAHQERIGEEVHA